MKPLLDRAQALFDDDTGWGTWAIEELPDVFGLIGKEAIPLLSQYLADTSYDEDSRVNITIALTKVVEIHPETR